jgi:hypothetical protein
MIFWSRTILIFIEIYIRRISIISSPNILIYKSILAERSTSRKIYEYIYNWKRMLIPKILNYYINRIKFLLMNELSLIQYWIWWRMLHIDSIDGVIDALCGPSHVIEWGCPSNTPTRTRPKAWLLSTRS